MDVITISETRREFNGHRYYLSKGKPYFQRVVNRSTSELLHRAVWAFHYGEIPAGKAVHHVNGNKTDNALSNLALMDLGEHMSLHMTKERREWSRQNMLRVTLPACQEWHRTSPDAHKLHMENAKRLSMLHKTRLMDLQCSWCGVAFRGSSIVKSKVRYCGKPCLYAAGNHQRKQKATGIPAKQGSMA